MIFYTELSTTLVSVAGLNLCLFAFRPSPRSVPKKVLPIFIRLLFFFGKAKSCFPFGCQPWTFRIDLCTIWSATETPIFFFFFVPSLSCLFILLFLKARFVWVANSAGRHFWRMENATSVIGSMFLHAPTNRCCNCFFILLKSPFHALVNTCWQHVAMLCWGCWFLVAFVEYLQIVKNNKSLLDR